MSYGRWIDPDRCCECWQCGTNTRVQPRLQPDGTPDPTVPWIGPDGRCTACKPAGPPRCSECGDASLRIRQDGVCEGCHAIVDEEMAALIEELADWTA